MLHNSSVELYQQLKNVSHWVLHQETLNLLLGASETCFWSTILSKIRIFLIYVIKFEYISHYIRLISGWWRRQWHPTPVLLPGKSHGWKNLVGCSPWGLEESDTTERLHFHFSRSCIGEGNGNPLQCSCLENPRDGGAWWAAVYGVAQSLTWLKWLSSSIRLIKPLE